MFKYAYNSTFTFILITKTTPPFSWPCQQYSKYESLTYSNNVLSDHLILLSCRLSYNLIMKKILKQLYQERKSTLGYILQKENFWNTSNEFLEDYILSIHRNIRSFLRNLKFRRDVFIWKYRFNIVRMQLESCMLDKWILTYL